jgi:transposase
MTKRTRRKFSADFKAKVALEAIKNQKTLAQLSEHYEVKCRDHFQWKAEFLENMAVIFKHGHVELPDTDRELDKLYAQIGQLKVENDFLKKSARKLGIPESELKW